MIIKDSEGKMLKKYSQDIPQRLIRPRFDKRTLVSVDFSCRYIKHATFRLAEINRCDFSGSRISFTRFQHSHIFRDCDFSAVIFSSCHFVLADFVGCNFHGAKFRKCAIGQVKFSNCDFSAAEVDCYADAMPEWLGILNGEKISVK